jgi:hypothetical protein
MGDKRYHGDTEARRRAKDFYRGSMLIHAD